MPASNSAALPQTPESGPEHVVRFLFPITWSFLSQSASLPGFEPKHLPSTAVSTELLPPEPTEPAPPARSIEASSESTAPFGDGPNVDHAGVSPGVERWEMVIPKMERPAGRVSTKLLAESSAAALRREDAAGGLESLSQISLPTAATADESTGEEFRAPAFTFLSAKPPSSTRKFVIIGAASLAALLLAGVLAFGPQQSATRSTSLAALAANPALPAGTAAWTPLAESPRRISVLRSPANLTDFRMDFEIPSGVTTAGWVLRARDARNYYAMHLEFGKSSVVLKRFAVIEGHDQPATSIPIASQPGGASKIRTEVRGTAFTVWIADRKIDTWTEPRLGKGGVGVYSEPGEPTATLAGLAIVPR